MITPTGYFLTALAGFWSTHPFAAGGLGLGSDGDDSVSEVIWLSQNVGMLPWNQGQMPVELSKDDDLLGAVAARQGDAEVTSTLVGCPVIDFAAVRKETTKGGRRRRPSGIAAGSDPANSL